jgi:CDP-glycerol glycerophosphotransferase (TagB/SpsB family)
MKFKIIEEEFINAGCKDKHYNKHVIDRKEYGDPETITPDDYENMADVLQRSQIDNVNIFGYIKYDPSKPSGMQLSNVKYNRATGDYVSYVIIKGVPKTITFFKRSWRRFIDQRRKEYYKDLPDGF